MARGVNRSPRRAFFFLAVFRFFTLSSPILSIFSVEKRCNGMGKQYEGNVRMNLLHVSAVATEPAPTPDE